MKRYVIFSLLISIIIFGGGSLNMAVAENGDGVVIVPFSADQPITENDVLDDIDALRSGISAEGEEAATIQRSLGDSPSPQKAKKGTVIVINESSDNPLIYLDDRAYGSCLPPGGVLKINKVPRGTHKFYAEDCYGHGHWGPNSFQLKKKVTFTLRD